MKVCIESQEDGTYRVYDESQAGSADGVMPPQVGQGAAVAAKPQAATEPQGQIANSLEEALQIVVRLFKSQAGGMKPSPFEQGFQTGQSPQGM